MLESNCATPKTSSNIFLVDDGTITGGIFKMRLDALYSEDVCFSCTDGTTTVTTNSKTMSVTCGESASKFTQLASFQAVQTFAVGDTSALFSWGLLGSIAGTTLCTTDYVTSQLGSSWG